jgi:crotonobetainyl-CoA:carnitine CoA-transferase CaiB-like acyl-CoA transferase
VYEAKVLRREVNMDTLPLEGIRIADCTQAWAGPHCVQQLADLGAEVIKVEPPYGATRGSKQATSGVYPDGEPGERPWNRMCIFNVLNRNRLAVSLDLAKEEGKRLFKELVKVSDIVVDNYAAGVMDRLGIGYEELKKVKHDIIMASINGYGPSGPWVHYHSFGVVQEPMCGYMALTGYVGDETPYRSGVDHIDPVTGTHMAGALVAALLHRDKTGEGQRINVSMMESALNFIGPAILDHTINGRILEHKGNRHNQDAMAPHGCYRCKGEDEWIAIAVGSDEEWEAFCRAIGNPLWTKEERFSHLYGRLQNQDDLDKYVEGWTLERDKYEAMHTLQNGGVAAGAVLDIAELLIEPHLKDRGFWQSIEHPEAGAMNIIGQRYQMSGIPTTPLKPAPLFGQHTDYVFKELLGKSDEEVDKAIEDGVVYTGEIADHSVVGEK